MCVLNCILTLARLKIDDLIDFLLAKSDDWSEVSLQLDAAQPVLKARHRTLPDERIPIHLIPSSRDILPLENFEYPCAIAVCTNPEKDERLLTLRGPKRLEDSRLGDWLIYLLEKNKNTLFEG